MKRGTFIASGNPLYAPFINMPSPCPQGQKSAMAIQNLNESGDESFDRSEAQGKHFKISSAHKIQKKK